MADAGEFSLIVASVESDKVADAGKQFARAFGLDETIAGQICKSAPIIFAQKLTKTEVKAITQVLTDLSKAGIEFRVTARVAGKLPKVNWPVRPQFTAGGMSGATGLAFEWDNNAFICPGCGETFLFRRLGQLKLHEPPAVQNNGSTASAPAVRQPVRAAVGAYTAPQLEGVEGMQPLAGEGESLDLPEALDEAPPAAPAKPSRAPAPPPEPELLPEPEPEPEEVAMDELPAAGEFSEAAEAPAPEPELAPEPEPEPVAEAEPVQEEAPAETGDLYNVFLSKITDTSKRDKAAELIAKIKGSSASEAKELTTRLVIPLAKNVSKDKAEDILNQFKKLKIFGRMTKVK
jgi:ribosomal protein L7/L12